MKSNSSLAFAAFLFALNPAPADTVVTGFRSTWPFYLDSGTIGFSFTVGARAVYVTSLGGFNYSWQNGFVHPYPVGLWEISGKELATVMLPAGTNAPLTWLCRYVDLPNAALLHPGRTYVLGLGVDTSYGTFSVAVEGDGSTTTYSPLVIHGCVCQNLTNSFGCPYELQSALGGPMYGGAFGPNAMLTVAPLPPELHAAVSNRSGSTVALLSWTNNGSSCVLESASGVTGKWNTISVPWSTNANYVFASVTNTAQMRFFRLRED